MSWMDEEPVRGGYPPVSFIALPGEERGRIGIEGLMPRPPISHLTGSRFTEAGVGECIFEVPVSPRMAALGGLYLAGTSALAADAPLGLAIVSTLPPGVFGVTSELTMNFLRPATTRSGALSARARVIDVGRSFGLSEAVVEDRTGTRVAHATSRYFLRRVEPVPDPPILEKVIEPDYPTPDPYLRAPGVPLVGPEELTKRSGLDVFRAMTKGDLPAGPFSELLGVATPEAEEGMVSVELRATEWMCSPARTIYGGIIAFVADVVMSGAVVTTLPAGTSAATLDLKVNFLRPGFGDGQRWTARGTVVHRGRNIAIARAEILNAEGKQIAIAIGSAMIYDGRPWRSFAVADEDVPEE